MQTQTLAFSLYSLDVEIQTMEFDALARRASVTFLAFPPVTLRPTGTVFDSCRAIVFRIYPAAGCALMSENKRQDIEERDRKLLRNPRHYFHPCASALKGPAYGQFSQPHALENANALAIVWLCHDVRCVTPQVVDRQFQRLVRRYFGCLPFEVHVNGPKQFSAKGADADLFLKRLWDPVSVPLPSSTS